MGHTGIARLCLVHRDYRTRTELAEKVREAPASIGRGGCHLKFVEGKEAMTEGFWLQNISSQPIVTWRGYAFENVCFNHISQIKKALEISGISTTQSAWTDVDKDDGGTQIDLIISRKDNVLNMCEMKFYSGLFQVDKKYDLLLRKRQSILREKISPKYAIFNTLVTTYGIENNEYRWSFDNVITMNDLFE